MIPDFLVKSSSSLEKDFEAELLADMVQPGRMRELLAVIVAPHVQVGVGLKDDRVGVDAFEPAEAAEAAEVLTAQHHREPCLARGKLRRVTDGAERMLDGQTGQLQIAEIA